MKVQLRKQIRLFVNPNVAIIVGFLLSILILWESECYAGPFLKINRIDAESEFPKVKIFLTAKNIDGTLITGLNEENIFLYEDGYRVNYVMVKSQSDTMGFLYFVFSIDSSKSISQEFLAEIKESARQIVNSVGQNDRIAIFRFNDDVKLLASFTNNKSELFKNIKKIETHGKNTLLYNSIYDSIDLLNRADVLKKAVIVFTDGKDEGSSVNVDDIIKFARDTCVPVYFICLKSSERIKVLGRISKLTGGKLIYSNNLKDVDGMYQTIMNMIKSQYIVKYQSMLEPDGKSHRVEVRLKYGPIRDRVWNDIYIKRRLNLVHLPNQSEILLLGLILILVALLIFVIIYTFRRNRKIIETLSTPREIVRVYPDYNKHNNKLSDVHNSMDTLREIDQEQEVPSHLYSKIWLMEKEDHNKWKKVPILSDELTLGSDEGNNIVIRDNAVSPMHARIKRVN